MSEEEIKRENICTLSPADLKKVYQTERKL